MASDNLSPVFHLAVADTTLNRQVSSLVIGWVLDGAIRFGVFAPSPGSPIR